MMKEILTYLAKSLVKHPDDVQVVEKKVSEGVVELALSVNQEDMGRVIGRNGKTARALRQLVSARGAVDNIKTQVEIVDN
ncbi:MAG: KH domain-containing protein [Candidatus Hinthialibacter antarcticus]|nr:KH domain-containing protein [Candidatus Hinthialibacter antarcticus]